MRRLVSTFLSAVIVAGSVTALAAAPVSERQAKKMLFKGPKFRVDMIDGAAIDAGLQAQVDGLVKVLLSPQAALMFADSGYYGAIAVVPDRPISEKSFVLSTRLHNPQAAVNAALAACNELDGPACVAVALILPKRYKPRDFSLSQEATEAFRSGWKSQDDPKYLAYSPSTNAFVIAAGAGADAAALEQCNKNAAASGVRDCVIGIAEE